MGRTVVTRKDVERELEMSRDRARARAADGAVAGVATPQGETPDTYKDRLLKFIPAEVVAIYIALLSLAKTTQAGSTSFVTVEWVVFFAVLVVTVPWQRKIMNITKWQQVIIGTGAFVFWAISLGDPFDTAWKAWYQPVFGTMAMMLYTFLIPLFEPQS